jgi:hypothetical protein
MLPAPVSVTLTVALAAVVVWCGYAVVRRPGGATGDRVPRDVEAWHGVMGVAMLLALRWVPSSGWAWLGCGVFAAMAVWCVVRGSSRVGVRHYGRAGFMAVAMVAMLVPAGAANAATSSGGDHAMHGMHAMPGMPGMSATASTDAHAEMLLAGPAALAVALGMLLVAALAVRLARRATGVRPRLSASCEAVMASAMAVMAFAMV